ncbi:MAG: formate--tetrahydrofolate ligase [Clostridiales bacterium]|jgi:formate--tetrahydrofolate ligase|nr:formate--tetrahydrofolate ligase [Clostridiales bacterium]
MKPDIQIAQENEKVPIFEVAEKFGINVDLLESYGKYKAKVDESIFSSVKDRPDGKLVLVTAINPTPAGEGKTTTTIGLAQALNRIGKKAFAALREPSLGPCMGLKGGAAGGGYSQVVPMEDINLHFTGDIHAMTCAHNLLAAMLDNHIHQGNALRIDPKRVSFRRALDMNDRSLRNIVVGLGGKGDGATREDGFMITVASEIMAIVCLSEDLPDMKRRLGDIIIGYNLDGKPVLSRDLKAQGAMTALLKEALRPNLVQTLEHTPAFVHGGPFANIAHGCNSVRATKLALKLSEITVTEAGFGADLGAEKFLDIKCRKAGLRPDAIVLVATIRALKYNGGAPKAALKEENLAALAAGFPNLEKHIENLKLYGVPIVVALNSFFTDTAAETAFIEGKCREMGCDFALSLVFEKGGEGGKDLARELLKALEKPADFKFLYKDEAPLEDKIRAVATKIYGAAEVVFAPKASAELKKADEMGLSRFPVCIAKTQYSLSDDPAKLGRPSGFTVTIRDIRISNGAGFIVALAGEIMTMPGLPKAPAAENIDVDENGRVTGLF